MTIFRVSHVDIGRAVDDGSVLIAEQLTITLRGRCRLLPAEPVHAILAS